MAAKKSLKSPLCQATKSNVFFVNKALGDLAVCETVKPGDEGPYIPNWAPSGGSVVLANPGNEKWQRIGSHFYVNYPGWFIEEACMWGETIGLHLLLIPSWMRRVSLPSALRGTPHF